jgi:murein DD-endopeptidase MepM/ murein hydrolase activator NlpD
MSTKYIVQRGDTLSKIAEKFGVDRMEIARSNGLNNQNPIRADQSLLIPATVFYPIPTNFPPPDLAGVLALDFRDAANRPIDGMEVSVSVAGEVQKHTTDSVGQVPVITARRDDVVKVEVKKTTGEWKKVSEVNVKENTTQARIVSPKVKVPAEMRIHEGPIQAAKTDKPAPTEVGTVKETRSEKGNPVQVIALECPNAENLKLGPNLKYREIIVSAGKRSGFSPQSIAAIMNAEAAVLVTVDEIPVLDKKTGLQKIGKDGKPAVKKNTIVTGEWDALSASNLSSARGMTQFLDSSWVDQALSDGSFLNERVKKEGWLTKIQVKTVHKKIVTMKEVEAFQLANGKTVTAKPKIPLARVLSTRPYITGRATSSDTNLQKLLDLRFSPEYAINAAVDYGLQNIEGLKLGKFKVDDLKDSEKAKLVYLTHHLGLDDAKKFIQDTMTAARAKYLLEQQLGEARAKARADELNDDYLKAHRNWLFEYIDQKIDLPQKSCDPAKVVLPRPLLTITTAIRP